MLAFLVKAGGDGVSFLEGDKQRWQRGTIVIAVFESLPRLFNAQSGELLHFPQTIDPGPVRASAVGAKQVAIFESPLLFECFLDARRECLLYFGEFILAAILFIILVCALD
jgi:hypothetical protein